MKFLKMKNEKYNFFCINCWDKYFLKEKKVPVVSGLAIINKYIKMKDAIRITYSFN